MNRLLAFHSVLALASGVASGQPRLDIIWRTPIGALEERVNHRGCVCPNGTMVLTYSNGAATLIDSTGTVVALKISMPELAGAVASVCHNDTVYISAEPPHVRVLRISAGPDLTVSRSFTMAGAPNRFVLHDQTLWVLGMARVGESNVPLRRFTISGAFLDAPEIGEPLVRGQVINQLLLQGSLVFHPTRQQVIYVPANPFRFFCFDLDGRLVQSKVAVGSRHEEADLSGLAAGPVRWSFFDWVRNVACLPDGRIVAQVIKGARAGGNVSYLEVFDQNLDLAARDIPIPFDMGYLLGSDAVGDLYFANLRIMGASVLKVRLSD